MKSAEGGRSVKIGVVWTLFVMAMAMGVLAGCGEPLHHNLEEGEANEIVVVLNHYGFQAEKVRDPDDGERWAVQVPASQRVDAWAVLQQEGLPRPEASGFSEFYPNGGLIPTAQEERVILQYATARELQASLLKIDGVVDAHVHLVLPEKPRVQMSNTRVSQPRASVLVKWREREGREPLSAEEIRRLVSGGVDGLEEESVHVVITAVERRVTKATAPELAQIGPLQVAPSSQGPLQVLILMMGGVIILLASGLVYLVMTRRREGEMQ